MPIRDVALSYNTMNLSPAFGLRPSLPEQIEAAAGSGFDLIGLDMPALLAHERAGCSAVAIGRVLASNGLRCHELSWLDVGPDRARVAGALDRVVRFVGALRPDRVMLVPRGPGANVRDNLAWAGRALSSQRTRGAVGRL